MGAEQDIGPVADGVADLRAEGLAACHHALGHLMAGIIGVGTGRIEFHRGEPRLDHLDRAVGGEIGVVEVVFALVVLRVEIGIGAQLLMHRAAEQICDRAAGGLADDVPAGDLQPGDDAHHGRVGPLGETARIGGAPEALDSVRIMAEQVALEHVVDQGEEGGGMKGGGIDFPDPLDPAIRLEAHQDPVHAAEMRRRHGDDMSFQRGDLHAVSGSQCFRMTSRVWVNSSIPCLPSSPPRPERFQPA